MILHVEIMELQEISPSPTICSYSSPPWPLSAARMRW
jgi:hypothetical protein